MKFDKELKDANIDTLDYWFEQNFKNLPWEEKRIFYKILPKLAKEIVSYQKYAYEEGLKKEEEKWK